jgi:GAF domain-containing protein
MGSAELNSKLEMPAETLAVLAEISQEINTSLNLDEVLANAAAQIKRVIDYEIFAVLLPVEGTQELYFRFAIGHRPEVVEHWRVPIGDGIIGSAAATGQAVRVGDVRGDPRYLNALEAVRSEMAVPLVVRGRVIGVLDIESSQPDYFTTDQQYILTLVASRIGTAIENARLFENARSQAETLLLLNEIGREANSSLQVEEILRRSVELTTKLIDYFTPDHVQVLSILAATLAVSIENAHLYEQVARDESRMERDLSAARRIQGALLPRLPGAEFGLDIAARVVSSRELSGDLYDFLRYGPQELGVALGDVSGKGSAAALYGAVGIGTLRSIGSQKPRPANMLRAINGFLTERQIEGRFMTLCFATWHRGRRRLRIANAGQEQPCLLHGGRCEKVVRRSHPCGPEGSLKLPSMRLRPNVLPTAACFSKSQSTIYSAAGRAPLCSPIL